jgi:hypothetical protein
MTYVPITIIRFRSGAVGNNKEEEEAFGLILTERKQHGICKLKSFK